MMDITVKTLDGQNRNFSVPENITVKQFKEKIANSISIPADTQRLIFQGKVLQDDKPLKDYDVHGKVVHVVVRPPPSANRPAGNDTPTPGPTPGMGGGNVSNIVVGSFTLPSDVLDPNSVQRIAQDAITAMGDMGRNARVSTRVSNDGSAMDVHIHLGSVPGGQVESEAQMRLNHARRMIRLANETLDQLEHPESASGDRSPTQRDTATGSHAAGQPMETTDTETPSTSQSESENEKKETGQAGEDVEMESANEEPHTATESANQEQPSSSQSETSSTTQQQPRGPVRPNITALGEVLEEVEALNHRLQPHLERFTQIVREDAQTDENELQQQQRVCNMVSEVMHSISHSYHALSDLMVDLSQPRPRQLYVTLAIAQPHTAVIQQTIPVQAQVLVGGSPRMVRRHLARNGSNPTSNQMTTDNAIPRQTTATTVSGSSTPVTAAANSTTPGGFGTTSTTQPSAPPPLAAGGLEAEIQAALRRGLGAAGMEGRGDGSPDNPYVFLEMGPDTISVNSISAQVVTSDDEDHDLTPPPTQATSTGSGAPPTSTAPTSTQAQNIPTDFLAGFVDAIMQSAGQAAFGGGGGQPQAMQINISGGQPGQVRMMGRGQPGNISMMGFPGLGRGIQVRPTVIRAGGPMNEFGTQTANSSGIPTNSGTQTSAAPTNTSGTQTSQAPPTSSSASARPTSNSTSGTQTPAGRPRMAGFMPSFSPVDQYLPCTSRHFLTQQARNMANQAAAQNGDTVVADMVNNLMSGLLGGAGNQPTTSAASSSASSGTSTSTTATPGGTSQPGTANQPGSLPRATHIRIEGPRGGPFSGRMPNLNQPGGIPGANIRIEGSPGLAGFFPGRMANLPGMRFVNIQPGSGIRLQTHVQRPGAAPHSQQPGQSPGAPPTSQSGGGGSSVGGTEPQFVQMLRNLLQTGSQQSQQSGTQQQTSTTPRPTTSAATTSTTTSTDQNQNIQTQPQAPISDEAFTRLVSGISSYMSQAAMGQAPRQSITDFLTNLGETYNIPTEEGIVNEVLSCILSCLQITDIIQVFYGNPGPLNQVREPLRQFVRTRVLDGRAATIENIQNSVTELVDGMQADIQDTVNNCSVAQSIDFQATLNTFFTQQFNNVIRFLMNAEEDSDTFGRDLYQCVRRLLSELVILCSRCLGGIQEVQRLVDHRIRNMTGGVNPVIQQWMANMSSQQLSQFIPTITVTEGEVSHYIINKTSQEAARVQEAECKVIERPQKSAKSSSKEAEKTQQGSSRESQNKRPASPKAAKEKIEPMETSTPGSSPGASEMEVDSNTNRATEVLPGALPAGAGTLPVVRPKTGTGEHPSPSGAQSGVNGDWQSVVPPCRLMQHFTTHDTQSSDWKLNDPLGFNLQQRGHCLSVGICLTDWVPVITRDIEKQKLQKSQQPHSDAYLQGMPPKRRKMMTQNRPGDLSNSSEALSASLRRAVATAAVEPISSLDNMTNEVSDNTELQGAFQEEVTSTVTQRLDSDTDYKSDKFPNSEDYFKKKNKRKTENHSGADS